jgi:putative ABC transport system permease protein
VANLRQGRNKFIVMGMLKNYLLTAYRNLMKSKVYSGLSILELAVGFAAAIFILLYAQNELGYDKHFQNHENIYRIQSVFNIKDHEDRFAVTALPLGPAFVQEFPEVSQMVRLAQMPTILIRFDNKEFYEDDFYYVDSTMFDIFSHEFVFGNPEQVLDDIGSVVLTESISQKYFGNINPVGQMMETDAGFPIKVTGVIRDVPENSHLRFGGLVSLISAVRNNPQLLHSLDPNMFWNVNVMTYIRLHEGSSPEGIYTSFPMFFEKYMKSLGDQLNATFRPVLTPLAKVHLQGGFQSDLPVGNKSYIYIFALAGIFILMLAIINYMNMATARSVSRSREVGIRKVAGAHRGQLIMQFLTESVLMALAAFVIALAAVQLLLPNFNQLVDKNLSLNLVENPGLFLLIVGIVLLVGLISGSYPAFYLSSVKPSAVIKGVLPSGKGRGSLVRKVLVVYQFWIAIAMLISTMVISSQMDYIRQKDLGFDKENLLFVQMQDSSFRNKHEAFGRELLTNPAITGVSNTSGLPGLSEAKIIMRTETDEGWDEKVLMLLQTDYNYLDVMGMRLVEGRNFDRSMATDGEQAAIINLAAARSLGWTDQALGKRIHFNFETDGSGGRMLKVIGLVADFHGTSLHNPIEPFIIIIGQTPGFTMAVRFNGSQQKQAIEHMQQVWLNYAVDKPFDYRLLSTELEKQYSNEQKTSILFAIASAISIFIALLGLLSLSAYTAEQRTKETGIRKVLGASPVDLALLLYRSFIILIALAFVLAVAPTWFVLNWWLESNFAFHTDVNWTTFILAGVLAFAAGLIAISYQLFKVIRNNPVEAIQYE